MRLLLSSAVVVLLALPGCCRCNCPGAWTVFPGALPQTAPQQPVSGQARAASAKPGVQPENSFVSPTGTKFIAVPLFQGGLAAESLAGTKSVRLLYVQRTEVSNREFKVFRPDHKTSYENVTAEEDPDSPVGAVTPADAREYAAWLTSRDPAHQYRLPTEGEWEAFCRAGSRGDHGWWGSTDAEFVQFANVRDRSWLRIHDYSPKIFDADDSFPGVAPVGSLRPNPWGLYDVLGNVWEICQSDHPQPSSDGAAVRGGSHADGPGIGPWSRDEYLARPPNVGFRLVAIRQQR